jgi:PTH2 family peptidyl-tRNA hydrolase
MYKQVIVVRKDLKMGRGKLAVQVAHASLDAYRRSGPGARKEWEDSGSKKVVLKVGGLKEILEIHRKAREMGMPCSLIRDAGKTQLPPGTVTALGIGPCRDEEIDRLTGKLKIL